ncbi:uncharacterized protein VP01_1845g3 [Puccinia sorghi]|uniref:Uncharacterized protein n=1 Tax=Puccinia sorghi TaxID=27349 RepID=A0A0L6VDS9_9BASI|nr:uncharacterized protein VP01_1845g3 [Puccinia sorghi]
MADDSSHAPPAQPSIKRPLTGLHMLLKTVLDDASNQDVSGAVRVPAGLINVLLEMLLSAERTMHSLQDTVDRLNASVDTKMSATNKPILAHLTELEKTLGPSADCVKAHPQVVW